MIYFYIFTAVKPSLDLGFVIGASGYKAFETLQKQKRIIKHTLKSYDVAPGKTQVGFVQKGKVPTIAMKLGEFNSLEQITAAVNKVGVNDAGRLRDALVVANDRMFLSSYGGRPGFNRSLVVFVNEKLDEDINALEEVGKKLKDNGVNVIVVGLNEEADVEKLSALSPLNHVFVFPPLLDELDMMLYPVIKSTYPGNISIYVYK